MMNKNIRKTTVISIFIILTLQMCIISFAAPTIPNATSDFYVNDFANVFTETEKATLMNQAVELSNTYDGTQVVVTTVKSLDGYTVEDYGYAMYKQYGIGKDDMGLLILLSTEDRKIRIEVGKTMEAYINDSKAGRFLDNYAIPKLKENKFNEGLMDLQTALIIEIKGLIDASNTSTSSTESPTPIDWNAVFFLFIVLAILGILSAIIFIIYNKSKKIKDLEDEKQRLSLRIQAARNEAAAEIQKATDYVSQIQQQKSKVEKHYSELISRFNTLEDRYNRATLLFPNLDEKVDIMIEEEIRKNDMAQAASVDSIIDQVITLSASKENLHNFENALFAYNDLTSQQKSYVKSDIKAVRKLHEKSSQLKYQHLATVAVAAITSIISGISIGKEMHISKLQKAKKLYEELSTESQKYVDSSIPEKISNLLKQAIHDKEEREEREEAERRRRRMQQSSISRTGSTFRSSGGGFGGFGGRPGGGGASRGF